MDEIRIQVIFRIDTKYGTFQDALWFSKEEYDKASQDDLDAMKQERVDNWIKVVTTPAPVLSKAEKVAQVQSEIDFHNARLIELQAQKTVIMGIK